MGQQRTVTLLVDAETMARTEQEVSHLSTWNLSCPKVTVWIDPKEVL